MEININSIHNDLVRLRVEIELLRNVILSEGELSDYAKKELETARKEPEEEYTDLEDL